MITHLFRMCQSMVQDKDPDVIKESADGLAECLKNSGNGTVGQQEFQQLIEMVFLLIDQSMSRSQEVATEKSKHNVGAPTELQPDEDEERSAEDDEENCRRALEEVLGALMEVAPELCVAICGANGALETKLKMWLSSKQNATLALFLACDLLQHLKEHSQPLWPVIMPAIFGALVDTEADLRIPAAYAVNLAAPIPAFGEAVGEAFSKLGQILSAPAPRKKREDKAKVALDNAVAAMLALAIHQAGKIDVAKAFELVISKLPLKEDEEEAKKVHKILAEQIGAQNSGLLGGNQQNLGPILKVLAEVHKQENICDKATDDIIANIFKQLPQDLLAQLVGTFTEKQSKKVERIMRS